MLNPSHLLAACFAILSAYLIYAGVFLIHDGQAELRRNREAQTEGVCVHRLVSVDYYTAPIAAHCLRLICSVTGVFDGVTVEQTIDYPAHRSNCHGTGDFTTEIWRAFRCDSRPVPCFLPDDPNKLITNNDYKHLSSGRVAGAGACFVSSLAAAWACVYFANLERGNCVDNPRRYEEVA